MNNSEKQSKNAGIEPNPTATTGQIRAAIIFAALQLIWMGYLAWIAWKVYFG
jgi:hypothetical protein